MKHTLILYLSLFCLFQRATGQTTTNEPAREYAQTITASDLSRHLHIIAADSMQGRDTGSPGQKMAADYISGQFFASGLKTLVKGSEDSVTGYYQPFELFSSQLSAATLESEGIALTFPDNLIILGNASTREEITGSIVFAGYGMEEKAYSDYAHVDVKDKIALIFLGEPKDKRGRSLITGEKRDLNWMYTLAEKELLAKKKGAKQVFFVDEANLVYGNKLGTYVNYAKNTKLAFKDANKETIPMRVILPASAAAKLLQISEKTLLKQAKRLAKKKKSTLKPNDVTIRLSVERSETLIQSENVLGLVEGSDKKDEVVVITAHYDHVGVHDGKVYNGADDDGSGTVAVIEMAQAFAKAKQQGNGPRRSILFMTVAGEEKGLLGSQYYTEHPIVPLANTVADLNIDMIGRVDEAHKGNPNYIYLIGSDKLSSELHQISEDANKKYTNIGIDYTYNDPNDPNRFYYRSDHYNFAKYKIPVIFYFNGVHADYHQPTDDVEKIDFNKMEKITRLIFFTAWELANREQRIKVDSSKP